MQESIHQKSPLVSVIIPADIYTPHLLQAIESVNNQTYPHLEVIIISHSALETDLKKIEDELRSQTNEGRTYQFYYSFSKKVSALINQGLKASTGEYLTVLLPIDYYHPQRIEKCINAMIQSQFECLFSRVQAVDKEGLKFMPDHPWRQWYEDVMFNMINNHTLEYNFLIHNIAVCAGNFLFSKKLYDKIGEFDEQTPFFSHAYILEAIPHFTISYLNEELYTLRLLEDIKHVELSENQEENKRLKFQYFLKSNAQKPSNIYAPSPFYSPGPYYKMQNHFKFNQMLNTFVQQPTILSIDETLLLSYEKSSKNISFASKSITLVTHDLALGGGAPKLLLDLAQELRNKGYKPNILSLANGPLRKEFENLQFPVKVVPRHLLRWVKKIGKFKRLCLLMRLLVYVHMNSSRKIIINSSASWPLALSLTLLSFFKQITWYIHESYSPIVYLQTGLAKKLLNKLVQLKTFNFWFGSDSTKNIWEKAIGVTGKVKYWSGLKTLPLVKNQKQEIKNLLAVGISHPRKGIHYLVDAFILCIKENRIPNDVCLTIIGIPQKIDTFNAEIILKIMAHNLQNRIKLHSCISAEEMNQYYKSADLFIQASMLECMPLSLLQAMSEGIPIITTDVNGCSEAIKHQETGYLCPAFSSSALANLITEAVQDYKKTRIFGENAQKFFSKHFAMDVTVEKILEEIKT